MEGYAKDIVYKHAGRHVNNNVLTIAHGTVIQIVEADVLKHAMDGVEDVSLVQEHVKVKHIKGVV